VHVGIGVMNSVDITSRNYLFWSVIIYTEKHLFRLFLSLLAWAASYPRESNLILGLQGAGSGS